jgi:hypothetical protein
MSADRLITRFDKLDDVNVARAAVAFKRLNADGTVTERTAAELKTDLDLSGTNSGNETAATIAVAMNAGTQDVTATDTDRIAVVTPAGGWMTLSTFWTWISTKLATMTSQTIGGTISFSSTTRPVSSGTGTPAATSLITKTDGDSLYLGLDATEISITGAITLTSTAFGKLHVCSGTSADYTVGLPAVSGSAGKTISFRMSSALTKLVTLDGNASETIGDATTRIMWANETAILLCDGTAWTKLAGISIPMKARAALATAGAAAQAIAASTTVVVNLTATESDSTGTMSDLVNNRLICRRAGTYTIFGAAVWDDGAGWAATRIISRIRKNGTTDIAATEVNKLSGGYPANTPATSANLALADYVELTVYQTNASSRNLYGDSLCYISMQEVVTW